MTSRDIDEALFLAQTAHKQGEERKAERLYRYIIRNKPSNPVALNNLSALLIEYGRADEALGLLRTAIKATPHYDDAIANMAACQGRLEDWPECIFWSKRAIRANECNPMPHLWRARAESNLFDSHKAARSLKEAISSPKIPDKDPLIAELVLLYFQNGQPRKAIKELKSHYNKVRKKERLLREIHDLACRNGQTRYFFRAIRAVRRLSEENYEIGFWLAKSLLLKEDEEQEKIAIEMLLRVAQQNPRHSETWLELAVILRKQKNISKALACLNRSIREDPQNLIARVELINIHLELAETTEAINHSAKTLRQFPNRTEALTAHCHALVAGNKPDTALKLIEAHKNRHPDKITHSVINCEGVAYTQSGQYEKAVRVFRDALKAFNQDASLWNNRGMAYGLANRPRPEIYCYRRAVALLPEDPGSHMNLAMARLAQGDYIRGIEEYEWRLKDRKGSLNGRVNGVMAGIDETPSHLLVVTEQGLGDTLHFSRYLHDLRFRLPHSHLTLACPEKLCMLLRSSFPLIDEIVSCEEHPFANEVIPYLPLMSLPYFCRIHPHKSLAPAPYIHVDKRCIEKARRVLHRDNDNVEMIIGLNWKGNPLTEQTNLKGRSMSLNDLKDLADLLPDAKFVSLQKGNGSDELETCIFRERFIENQSAISEDWCFVNTSAYILACDYVVTTDTSIAHLSGALGQATHLLLAHKSEWRWGNQGSNTPWYPAMRLSRQVTRGDWCYPVNEVATQIQQHWLTRQTD